MQDKRYSDELKKFSGQTVVHNLPLIQSYWSNKYLKSKFAAIGFEGMWDFYTSNILEIRNAVGKDVLLNIASIGSGNCDVELKLALELVKLNETNFKIDCIDINEAMLKRGYENVNSSQMLDKFSFTCQPIANINYSPDSIHVFFANQSLHHILELEALIQHISYSMNSKGRLLIGDMIGRNGHMFWPESLFFVNLIWNSIKDTKKHNHRNNKIDLIYPNIDHSKIGYEGIRSQDILPLLNKAFHQDVFLGFSSIIRPFISRAYGHNYAPSIEADSVFIDFLSRFDDELIDSGTCKPMQCFATFSKSPVDIPRNYRHWTSEFCERNPSEVRRISFDENLKINI